MTAKVLKFEPVEVGSDFRFDADEILEGAKGQPFTCLAIIGQLEDGSQWITGNANAGEILVMMERAKHHLVFGED
jgi:hypothetical protein